MTDALVGRMAPRVTYFLIGAIVSSISWCVVLLLYANIDTFEVPARQLKILPRHRLSNHFNTQPVQPKEKTVPVIIDNRIRPPNHQEDRVKHVQRGRCLFVYHRFSHKCIMNDLVAYKLPLILPDFPSTKTVFSLINQ